MRVLSGMLCLLLALLGACTDEQQKAAGNMPEVGVVEVTPQPVTFTMELPGRTLAYLVAEVRPQVGGILQKRLFVEGADVKAGDVLYQIDPAIYKAALDSAQANLAKAHANVEPARLKAARFRNLVQTKAVSRQDFEDADAAYKQAVAAEGECRAAVQEARIRLDYTRVTAPISGRIGRSLVTPGALVTAGQGAAMSTIQQLDPVYVDVTQSSVEMLQLKRRLASGQLKSSGDGGAAVRLVLEDGTSYSEEGTLQFTDVTVEESTGSVTVRAVFPNPRHELLPGMYVRAVLEEGTDEQAILVPQKALQRDPKGRASVWLVNAEGKVENRDVVARRTHGTSWVIEEGLQGGERVIVTGLQRVRPGIAVRAVPAAEAAAPAAQ